MRMSTKHFILTVIGSLIWIVGFNQNPFILVVNQADPLVADAGSNKAISKSESVTLGGSPSASKGYGSYVYDWSPITGLDNPSIANPKATPEVNTTYLLTVRDANNCSATDEVSISVDASGINLIPEGLQIKCYPNPVGSMLTVEITGAPSGVTIKLLDPIGKELVSRVSPKTGRVITELLPTADFAPGIYFLLVIEGEKTIYKPILKTR